MPDFALIPVLQKLHYEHSTGRLQVRPEQGSYGTIYFSEGQIVHAAHATLKGVEAFITIIAWNIGVHSFRPNIIAKEHSIELPFFELLSVLGYGEQLGDAELLTALEAKLLNAKAAAPESRHVNRSYIQNDERHDTYVAHTNTQRNRLENAAKGAVSKVFMNELTELFIDIKGPIARIIMEDISYDLGYDLEYLPRGELRTFCQSLVKEIPSLEAQRNFVASLRLLETQYSP